MPRWLMALMAAVAACGALWCLLLRYRRETRPMVEDFE